MTQTAQKLTLDWLNPEQQTITALHLKTAQYGEIRMFPQEMPSPLQLSRVQF